MVFLHPEILKDSAISNSYTADKYNFIRAKQIGMRDDGISLMYDDVTPILRDDDGLCFLVGSSKDGSFL